MFLGQLFVLWFWTCVALLLCCWVGCAWVLLGFRCFLFEFAVLLLYLIGCNCWFGLMGLYVMVSFCLLCGLISFGLLLADFSCLLLLCWRLPWVLHWLDFVDWFVWFWILFVGFVAFVCFAYVVCFTGFDLNV